MDRPLPDLTELGRRAQVFGIPTIDLYRILDSFALDPSSPEFKAPLGQFAHSRRLADPSDRSIVAMNVDTPYSYAWLDLRDGPVVLTLPAFEPDRYVAAELFDLYTYIVGYVSPRTNGTRGGSFLITGPGQTARTRTCRCSHARRSCAWCSCARSCSATPTCPTSWPCRTR